MSAPGNDLSDPILADLTPAQAEAVRHMDGPLLILAGAGSGKTRVITRRVAYLLQHGVKPYNILAITFTNKASQEMRQRIDALVPGNRLWISTFHSFGARVMRQYAEHFDLDKNFTIYDMDDRAKVIKIAMDAVTVPGVDKFTPDRIGGAISRAKNQLLDPAAFHRQADDFLGQIASHVYAVYQKKLKEANAVDFDDLLYMPAMALQHNEDFRATLDSRFKYVLIDEYQDTNQAQYIMARTLSKDNRNICVVGDPDQSVYAWRGANIRNILDFERDFPQTTVITLERNYRSTKSIIAAASALIAKNKNRKKKNLTTDNPQGEPVRILTFDNGLDEADQIVRQMKEKVVAKQATYREMAVFVRMNALTRTLESAFIKHGIPYQIVKGLAFFDRKENKDILAYLRLLVNPQDGISFLRACNEPARGIGKVSLEHLSAFAEQHQISLLRAAANVEKIPSIKGKASKGLKDFAMLMHNLRQHVEDKPHDVINLVLEQSGYRAMLKDSKDAEDEDRLANVEELITAAMQFYNEDGERTIGDFIEQITLASDVDGWDDNQDHVSVMTLHASKGLEFPIVYMIAMEEGILPHERSLQKDEDVEEERRLAFVGMTRAMRELYLCHAKVREFRGQSLYAIPSSFLGDLPADVERKDLSFGAQRMASYSGLGTNAPFDWKKAAFTPSGGTKPASSPVSIGDTDSEELAQGLIVQHEGYGIGQILDVSGYGALRKVKIRFATQGDKTFVADKVKLKIVKKKTN